MYRGSQERSSMMENMNLEAGATGNRGWIWGSHNGGYEELYLMGYNALQSVESQLTFRRNMLPSSSGSKNKSSKWHVPPKCRFTLKGVHTVISQKTELFICPIFSKEEGWGHTFWCEKNVLPKYKLGTS
jgi:hypothetical protein